VQTMPDSASFDSNSQYKACWKFVGRFAKTELARPEPFVNRSAIAVLEPPGSAWTGASKADNIRGVL
jgi:hypothetical protein